MTTEQYSSAEEAFYSLNIGKTLKKRLVSRKCKKVGNAVNIKVPRMIADWLVGYIFQREYKDRDLFRKAIRAGQVNDTDHIVVFADEYVHSTESIDRLIEQCTNAGIVIEPFEKRYPQLEFSEGFIPPDHINYLHSGYDQFYRGVLSGFIIK